MVHFDHLNPNKLNSYMFLKDKTTVSSINKILPLGPDRLVSLETQRGATLGRCLVRVCRIS